MRATIASTARTPGPARESRGFILIESLIVVAIIGIIAAIVVPGLSRARQTAQAGAQMGMRSICLLDYATRVAVGGQVRLSQDTSAIGGVPADNLSFAGTANVTTDLVLLEGATTYSLQTVVAIVNPDNPAAPLEFTITSRTGIVPFLVYLDEAFAAIWRAATEKHEKEMRKLLASFVRSREEEEDEDHD